MSKPIEPFYETYRFCGGPLDGAQFEGIGLIDQFTVLIGDRLVRYECDQQTAEPREGGRWAEVHRLVETTCPEDFDETIAASMHTETSDALRRIDELRERGIMVQLKSIKRGWQASSIGTGDVYADTFGEAVDGIYSLCQQQWTERGE